MGKDYGEDCPLARTAEIVAERWTPLILRELFAGRCRFTHIAEDLPGISPRLLSARLRRLESQGVVVRVVDEGHPGRAAYHLTESGRALRIVVLAMSEWGAQHCPDVRPTRLAHLGCGGAVRLQMRCATCDRPLEAAEMGPATRPAGRLG